MKNFEVYEDKIKEYDYDFARKNGEVIECYGTCKNCDFRSNNFGNCKHNKIKWLYEEYKEPIKLSRLEFELLKYFKGNGFEYIVIDKDQKCVHIYTNKPKRGKISWFYESGNIEFLRLFKDHFQFVKWEDEEPTLIQNILDNCEVINDE